MCCTRDQRNAMTTTSSHYVKLRMQDNDHSPALADHRGALVSRSESHG